MTIPRSSNRYSSHNFRYQTSGSISTATIWDTPPPGPGVAPIGHVIFIECYLVGGGPSGVEPLTHYSHTWCVVHREGDTVVVRASGTHVTSSDVLQTFDISGTSVRVRVDPPGSSIWILQGSLIICCQSVLERPS